MTAVLQNLRQLEAARRRGELSLSEYASRRAEMMAAVEDAALDADIDDAAGASAVARAKPPSAWLMAGLLITGCTLMTLLGAWATGDLSLALTVSVTLLAALMVAAFQSLGE
ncbi:MAG: hypothetical protein AAGM84_16440 [Pseudomonadota bacterium]